MLYSNGFSVEEARQAARTFNGFCGQDTSRHKLVRDPGVLRLKTLLESREMPLPAESSAQ
jgi:hypothetical protein